jgi:hypothetical protein
VRARGGLNPGRTNDERTKERGNVMKKLFASMFAMVAMGIVGAGCAATPIDESEAAVDESEAGEAQQALACRPYDGVTCYYSAGSSKANCYCSGPGCIWLAIKCVESGGEQYYNADGQWYCQMSNPC